MAVVGVVFKQDPPALCLHQQGSGAVQRGGGLIGPGSGEAGAHRCQSQPQSN